jgi:signal transduction histidine kinase
MIELSVNTKPFSVPNESGDFYQYVELEDYFLLVVGDIGGHGSARVYELACSIQNIIEQNKEKSLAKIITIVHQQEMLHNNGMTLFIAQIYKTMPMINYSAVGNTKATIIRKNNFLALNIQEGILGYDIPSSIKTYMTKIFDGDILLVATDGVSIHKEQFMNKFKNTNDITLITKYCVEDFGNDDDRLCLALSFQIGNNKYFSLKHNDNNIKNIEENINQQISTKTIVKSQGQSNQYKVDLQKNDYKLKSHHNQKLTLLDNERLLFKNLTPSSVQYIISKVSHLAQIDQMLKVKIKTFLYEITKYSNVDIYLDSFLLQLHIYDIKDFQESLEFLFKDFFISHQKEAIINIELLTFSQFDNEKFNALKEMFELGFDDIEYEKYKENEKRMQQLSSQARLSAMGEMIGNIAHQWRQPLSVISTSATSLSIQKEFGILTDEMLYKACDSINESAQYLSKTIDDFRDFIKGESFEEEFELESSLSKAFNIAQASIKDNYIKLFISPYENIKLFGAQNLLIQVVVNIISNAKDILIERFIEDKLIFVDISHTQEKVSIKITDNGGGVPKEIIDKIFDAYFTTKHQSKGTGLGLNMSFNIIMNSFKGTLEVLNETFTYQDIEYTGASFIITLPLHIK